MTTAVAKPPREPKRASVTPEPWLATVGRVFVHAAAASVFAWPLAVADGVVAAAIGAGVGSVAGRFIARTRLRLPAIVALSLLGVALAFVVRDLVVGQLFAATSLGPSSTLRTGDIILFGFGACSLSAGLRALSSRVRSLAVLEVALVGLAFAQLVAAHRNGAINRPFDIADPILARGEDPTLAFLAIGVVGTAVVVILLLSERSIARSILHLGVVALILMLVVGTTTMIGPPAPPPTGGGLGLRDQQQQGGQGGRGGRRNNEQLEFRDDYSQSANQVPVAVVLLHDDYSPPSGVYYFRQGAFSQYNGKRLVAATRGDVDSDIAPSFPSSPMNMPGAPPAGQFRSSVETTVALLADHTRPFGLESPTRFEPAPNPASGRFRRAYKVDSAVLTADTVSLLGATAGSTSWNAEQWEHYTTAPGDPRYGELTGRIIEEMLPEGLRDDSIAKASAITAWLGKNGTYSLRSRHAGAEDPTAHFLFGDITGYCVHFAHAAAYLMRSAGLPARVATGYAVEESARQGGSALLITGQTSHAWPEVYLDGVGWVVMDVVPERTLDPAPRPPDPDLQRLLAEMLRGESPLPQDGLPRPTPVIAAVREAGATAAVVLGSLALVLLVLLFVIKVWRRAAPLVSRDGALPRVVYRAELDRLSDVSLRRLPGESREAFAARLAALSPSFRELTKLHVGAAFGSRRRVERQTLRTLARSVRREVGARIPWWRRAVGAIVPWTWLRAR